MILVRLVASGIRGARDEREGKQAAQCRQHGGATLHVTPSFEVSG
jgi:hypothetical protein